MVLGRPQQVSDRLQSDGYEDEQLHEGSCQAKYNSRTQRIDFGLRAMNTYGNTESCARHKENSWEATDGNTEGCN